MGSDHSRKATSLAAKRGPVQRERETHRHPANEPTHEAGSRPSTGLLGNPMLGGRGNQSVQIELMQEMQQAYGNRAVQRFMQRRAPVAPSPAAPFAVDARSEPAPANHPIQRRRDFKPVQRDDKPGTTDTQKPAQPYVMISVLDSEGKILYQKQANLNANLKDIPLGYMYALQNMRAVSMKSARYEAEIVYEKNGVQHTEEIALTFGSEQEEFAEAFKKHGAIYAYVSDPSKPLKKKQPGDKDQPAGGPPGGQTGPDKPGTPPDQAPGGKGATDAGVAGGKGTSTTGDKDASGSGSGGSGGSKYGFLGLLHLPDSVSKLIDKAFEAMGGTEEYLAMMDLLRNLKDFDDLLPQFKDLLDPDKLLDIMLGIEENDLLKGLAKWANSEPTSKAPAAKSSSTNALVKLAGKVLKLLTVTRKVLRPIFKIRAGAQKVFVAATGLLEEMPELEDLLNLSTDKTASKHAGFGDLMNGISASASRAIHGKLIDVRKGFALKMEKLDLISAQDVGSAIMAALLPLIPWRYRIVIKPFKNQIAKHLLANVIPDSIINTINGKVQELLDPLVKGAEKLLDEALNKIESAVHDHLLPELKLAVQPTAASKAIAFGKKIAPIMTAGIKASKSAAKDPKRKAEAEKITRQASKLITDKTVINDASPPKLPTAFDGKEQVYKYIRKNGEIVNIRRLFKWVLMVPKLGVAGKRPKRIVGGLLSNPAISAFSEAELKKAKAKFGTQLFWREDLQDLLNISKSTALVRINEWKSAKILFQLESGAFDPETQYSFDKNKAGQREVSKGNRSKYGYSNPKKESTIGLEILSKGLNPMPKGDPKSRDFHMNKARYHSMRLGSKYTNFAFPSAILGHGKEGASEHWNRIGHKQPKQKNVDWNYDPKNYHGPEHEYESAASGGSSDRYRVPSKHAGSHPDWL